MNIFNLWLCNSDKRKKSFDHHLVNVTGFTCWEQWVGGNHKKWIEVIFLDGHAERYDDARAYKVISGDDVCLKEKKCDACASSKRFGE